MDAPIPPRIENFGLKSEELPRLARYWYPPISSLEGPAPDATFWVRALRPRHFVILGIALTALWIFLSTQNLTDTFFVMFFFGGGLGAAAGAAVAGLIVRPLYDRVAKALVPGLDAHCRFRDAQDTYQQALTKFNLWRARTLTEFWCSLDGVVFEREVARLYEGLGYKVRLTPQSCDGGVDVVLERAGSVTAVQCKAHRKKIGIAVGRELMTSAKDLGADRMMIACTHGVSAPLQVYAREKGIQIVTACDLVYMQMGLKEMSAVKLLIEHPASIAKRLKGRIAASPGAGGSSRG